MNSLLRGTAFIITIGMMKLLQPLTFLQLVTSFGIAHYLQVTFVARKKYQEVFLNSFKRSPPLGSLMAAILVFSLVIGLPWKVR